MSGVAQPQDPFSLKEHLLLSLSWERAGRCVRIGCCKITMMRYSSCLRVFSGGREESTVGMSPKSVHGISETGEHQGKLLGVTPQGRSSGWLAWHSWQRSGRVLEQIWELELGVPRRLKEGGSLANRTGCSAPPRGHASGLPGLSLHICPGGLAG